MIDNAPLIRLLLDKAPDFGYDVSSLSSDGESLPVGSLPKDRVLVSIMANEEVTLTFVGVQCYGTVLLGPFDDNPFIEYDPQFDDLITECLEEYERA